MKRVTIYTGVSQNTIPVISRSPGLEMSYRFAPTEEATLQKLLLKQLLYMLPIKHLAVSLLKEVLKQNIQLTGNGLTR
jgi:hypothetical protein